MDKETRGAVAFFAAIAMVWFCATQFEIVGNVFVFALAGVTLIYFGYGFYAILPLAFHGMFLDGRSSVFRWMKLAGVVLFLLVIGSLLHSPQYHDSDEAPCSDRFDVC